jgi:cytoskeletal protein RodZ
MTMRRRVTGVLLLAVLALTGCTAETEPPRSSSSSAPTPSEDVPAPSETSSALTPEEEAAQTATTVVNELLRVTDAAKQDPAAGDWEPEIRRYAGDPAALLAVTAVRDYAALGLRQEGDTAVGLEVTAVELAGSEGPTVKITGCYDSQSTRVVKVESGDVVPPGTLPRYVLDITVTRYDSVPGSPWLVNVMEPLTDRPC